MTNRIFFLLFGAFALCSLASCESTTTSNPPPFDSTVVHSTDRVLFILNEGDYTHANSSLDAIIFRTQPTVDTTIRHNILTRLGEGNDILTVGNRVYVLDEGSNQLIVVDADSLRSIATIPFGTDGPNKMALIGSNQLLVTRRNVTSAAIINLTTNTITDSIPIGEGSIAVAVLDNSAFISGDANGGPGHVHIINVASHKETKTLTLLNSPERVEVDSATNQIVVGCDGIYDSIAPRIYWIDTGKVIASVNVGSLKSQITFTTGDKRSLILDGVPEILDMTAHSVGAPIVSTSKSYYEGYFDRQTNQYFLGVSDFISGSGAMDVWNAASHQVTFSAPTGIGPAHFAFYH
jgi:YVTN family beta-propeller protein